MSDSEAPDDRRQSQRHIACFPAHIQRSEDEATKPRTAMIKDLSIHGAFLLTRGNFTVGAPISLALYLSSNDTDPKHVEGTVVRVTTRPLDRADFWHFDVAVQFHEPQSGIEAEIEKLADRQAALGIYKKG
ncbi:MAG: PilZ domain-containing protein [Polyangiales bacterium]